MGFSFYFDEEKCKKMILLETISQKDFNINEFYVKPKVLVADSECPEFYSLTRIMKEYAKNRPEEFMKKIDSIVFEVHSKKASYQIEIFKDGKIVYAPSNTTLTILDVVLILNEIYYDLHKK